MRLFLKTLPVLATLMLTCSCQDLFFEKDPDNSKEAVFDYFWKGIDETWPQFATKPVNWDSLYAVYRPKVNPSMHDQTLLSYFQVMLNALGDAHVNVYPRNLPVLSYQYSFPKNTYGFSWLRNHYLKNARDNEVVSQARVHPEVGYIYIPSFGGSQGAYEVIDQILSEFQDAKGVIIDIRNNGGGSTNNSEVISSRFITQKTTYAFSRFRTGTDRNVMSDFVPNSFEPHDDTKYPGKVIVLIGRQTFSTAEDFSLNMRSAGALLMGDNTLGGSGSKPVLKELPNGWLYRVSTRLIHTLSKEPITDGIVPDFKVALLKADSINGKDTILESAIREIIK